MSEPLTPERRAELRRTLDLLIPARYEAMNMPTAEILALLDAADERDRLVRDAERWHLAYVGESIRASELEAELADRGSQCNR